MDRLKCRSVLLFLVVSGLLTVLAQNPSDVNLAVIEAEMPDCMDCHGMEDLTGENEFGDEISLFIDLSILEGSAHASQSCFSCHSDLRPEHPDDEIIPAKVNCAQCHEEQSVTYETSVHAKALHAGDEMAPSCVDCHGSHDITNPLFHNSPLHWTNLPTTCGDCHPGEADEVNQSVHGLALAENIREAPSCTDCHSEHSIEGLKETDPMHISRDICSRCHASERIATKFKLPTDSASTFFASYHGLAADFGLARAANCASCHGYHLVLPSSDERSMIHPANLQQTCGSCHPGASENFASSRVHVGVNGQEDIGSIVKAWVRAIYILLIFGTIGFMLVHNGIVMSGKWRKSHQKKVTTVTRMDLNQRIQHWILLSSFIILAVSGFALEYPRSIMAWLMGSDEDMRRLIHRIAAVTLMTGGVYHIFYLLFTGKGRRLFLDIWPCINDVKAMAANLKYWLHLKGAPPKFGRFGYVEKLEYWAVIWGTIIMGVTGMIIWFKIEFTTWMPRWVVDVAGTIHYYEAILAILAILVWHFYHVFLDPGVYPMNTAWWNGKVPEKWYKEEHGLDPALYSSQPKNQSDPVISLEKSPNTPEYDKRKKI